MYKFIKIIFCLVFVLFTLSIVSANENVTSDIHELGMQIDQTGDMLNLTRDYVCSDEELNINKNITIDGNNHTISSKDSKSVLKVNVNDFCSLVFKNINFNVKLKIKLNSSNITFINSDFNCPSKNDVQIFKESADMQFGKTGPASKKIIDMAKKIVGKSKGLNAAKKLASWVGKNIKHETKAGFYQNPDVTLNRRVGNCCSQTLLFLQMCDSLGITKHHKVCFVHADGKKFGSRHFFAIIDNLCIDVDSYRRHPWGHAKIMKTIYQITEYPILPLPKEY